MTRLATGFLGPRGTFSEEALIKLLKRDELLKPFSTIEEVLKKVEQGEIDRGFVPIENSVEGSVNVTLDMMIHEVQLKILKEITIPVRHNLIASGDTNLQDIRKVYSHPQAIAQCRKFLSSTLPMARVEYTESTAEAIKQVLENRAESCAIGTLRGASLFGLEAKLLNIQDYTSNQTRFVLVVKDDLYREANLDIKSPIDSQLYCKTSIIFSLLDKPGTLHEILGHIVAENVNIKKIESRPAKRSLGEYVFIMDLEGHETDAKLINILQEIKNKALFFKNLGSYQSLGE